VHFGKVVAMIQSIQEMEEVRTVEEVLSHYEKGIFVIRTQIAAVFSRYGDTGENGTNRS
jgi:hypothetical protein